MILALALGASIQAQDKPAAKVSLASRGGTALAALESFAASLGYTLRYSPDLDTESDLSFHVWMRAKDTTPERAARILTFATGNTVRLDAARRQIVVEAGTESTPRGTVLKGYDVSVACSRFVLYQNTWGQQTPKPAANTKPEGGGGDTPAQPAAPAPREQTAAEHLAQLLEYVLGDDLGGAPEFAVVGDRLLLRDGLATHARVKEMLDLLVSDNGGGSASARDEAALIETLRKAKPPLTLDETPLASVLAQFCDAADVDFAINAGAVDWLEEEHVSLELTPEISVLDAMKLAFHDDTARWIVGDGAVFVGGDDSTPVGYRVFEAAELMKKIDAGIQRQRTAPDRRDGFTGDLRSLGGVQVIVDALVKVVGDAAWYTQIECWGTRVIVRGSYDVIATAEAALKEMGWEPPKGN